MFDCYFFCFVFVIMGLVGERLLSWLEFFTFVYAPLILSTDNANQREDAEAITGGMGSWLFSG